MWGTQRKLSWNWGEKSAEILSRNTPPSFRPRFRRCFLPCWPMLFLFLSITDYLFVIWYIEDYMWLLDNNINHTYQSIVNPGIMSLNLTIPILFDKNQAQSNVALCKFQVQRIFIWECVCMCVLENNINLT